MKEIWKKCFIGDNYFVSNLGNVKFERPVKQRTQRRGPSGYGYPTVTLDIGKGRLKTVAVHKLVNVAFNGKKPSPGHVTRHLDGNPQNNTHKNVVWGTHKENQQDRFKHGTAGLGEKNGFAKLNKKIVLEVRRLYRTGEFSQRALASKFSISQVHVGHIVRKQVWRHV